MTEPATKRSSKRSARNGSSEQPPEPRPHTAWEQIRSIAFALALALVIRIFLLDSFRIPSESMLSTLLVGDHLFISKLTFGPRVPYTELRFPGWRDPERGDIVVFTAARDGRLVVPADRRPELPTEDFIKRVVGLPGDTIEVRNGVLLVNGAVVRSREAGATFTNLRGRALQVRRESLGSCSHLILDDPRSNGLSQAPIKVEPGRYFMMGDNRDDSSDSRKFGSIRRMEIKGPALFLYFSWDYNGGWAPLLNPLTWWSAEKRWGRTGRGLGCDEVADAGP